MDRTISTKVYPFRAETPSQMKKEQRQDKFWSFLRLLCEIGIGCAVALFFLTAGAGEVGVVSMSYTVGRALLAVGLLIVFGFGRKVVGCVQRRRRRERLLRRKVASAALSRSMDKAG